MRRWPHSHACEGTLITGPCPTRTPCDGPLDEDGVCPGDGMTWCEDCSAAIYAGDRCDSCGLIDASVGGPGPKDRYCKDCLALVDAPVAEPTHGVARDE